MSHTIIIAEAGVNHCGSPERALAMIDSAAAMGADYVKFQTFKAEALVSASAPKAAYQQENDPRSGTTQLEMLRALELSPAHFALLAQHARERGIGFLSTPFDSQSMATLAPLGMDFWKIPSGEVTNLPYLRRIAAFGMPVMLSTGMSTLQEVEAAVEALCHAGLTRGQISLLHCNTQYPTPPADVNLRAMDALRSLGCHAVGFSDHTAGIAVPIAAVALGAQIIEKHFTLSRQLPGPDHRSSLEPAEFAQMVSDIRTVEQALGTGIKAPTPSETPNINAARRSIVAARHISKGELLGPDNLTTKRPGGGLSPMLWDRVCGQKANRNYLPDEAIDGC